MSGADAAAMTARDDARWTTSAVLWIAVLTTMAGFQTWRGAIVDGVVFFALAAVLVLDRLTRGRIQLLRRPPTAPRWMLLAVIGALGVALIVAPRHGPVSFAVVSTIGVVVLVLAWAPTVARPTRPAPAIHRSMLTWSIIGVGLCLWEAIAFILSVTAPQGSFGFPTVSVLLDPAVEFWASRVVLVAAWLLGGLALLDIGRSARS